MLKGIGNIIREQGFLEQIDGEGNSHKLANQSQTLWLRKRVELLFHTSNMSIPELVSPEKCQKSVEQGYNFSC